VSSRSDICTKPKRNVLDFVEYWASETPDAVAVESADGIATYQDLKTRILAVSKWLAKREVAPEISVGVSADRSLNWAVGAAAVLRSGGVYVPINPMSPLQRKIEVIGNSRMRLLLTESHLPPVSGCGVEVEYLEDHQAITGETENRPEIWPNQAAYAVYTSGSTGTPKSVIVVHEALWHYTGTVQRQLETTPADKYLHTANIEFSASIRQLFTPLTSGAGVVIATREQVRDPSSLIHRMLQARVTVFDTVPSYLGRWLDALRAHSQDEILDLAKSLRIIVTTGEPIPQSLAAAIRNLLPTTRVFNLYGQTETTGTVSFFEIHNPGSGPIPIGHVAGDNEFFIVDEFMQPTSEGELCISGSCLARCYGGQPELTSTRFQPNPFSSIPGSRLYRTGDRVRRLQDGLMQYIGRVDSQVKLHGVRIELGDVEAALLTHPDIQEAAVVLRRLSSDTDGLVAFVVPRRSATEVGDEDLRRHVKTRLGDGLTPARVVVVNELPRTLSGKVDRPCLVEAQLPSPNPRNLNPEPLTSTERLVANCWGAILGIGDLAADDDFFSLGGDSIQAMQMVLKLQRVMHSRLPLGALFLQDPTLREFAKAIDEYKPPAV